MFNKEGKLEFAKEVSSYEEIKGTWKILIVDDEADVHTITKTVLSGFNFEGKTLEFLSAYSAQEAKVVLKEHSDISVILLDVVMEEDESGLELIHFVREELQNSLVRIVLRTGQPGMAPERDIIVKYDINDYKEKTELTSDRLFTTIIASIRNYRDLIAVEEKKDIIEQNRIGLKNIINSSANLFEIRSLDEFTRSVLLELSSLIKLNTKDTSFNNSGFILAKYEGKGKFLGSLGSFEDLSKEENAYKSLPTEILEKLQKVKAKNRSSFENGVFIGYYKTHNGYENFIYMDNCEHLSVDERRLIHIFSSNISIAFDNVYLDNEIMQTQAEVIYTLGEVMENRSKETASHVSRVAKYSYLLAKKYGLSEEEALILKNAAPLHDIGKIGIPDSILMKPGKLDSEEFTFMQAHAKIGYEILKNSTRSILKAAAIVAHEHHEKWDGSGYPNEKSKEDIHIYGRIVAIADVFDALTHKRVYKEAWSFEKSLEYLQEQKGKHFDPELIELFMENIESIKEINEIK